MTDSLKHTPDCELDRDNVIYKIREVRTMSITTMVREICSTIKIRAYGLDWPLSHGAYAKPDSMSVMDLLEAEGILRATADQIAVRRERLQANDPDRIVA